MKFLQNLKLTYKFLLILGLISIPIAVLGTLFLGAKQEGINFAEKEISGVEYIVPLGMMMANIAEHNTLAAGSNSDQMFWNNIPGKENEIKQDIAAVDVIDKKYGEVLGTTKLWNEIKTEWNAIKSSHVDQGPEESFYGHQDVIFIIRDLIAKIGDSSKMLMDPDLDSYYLMDAIVHKLPSVIDDVENLRAQLVSVTTYRQLQEDQRLDYKILLDRIEGKLTETKRVYDVASSYKAEVKKHLGSDVSTFISAGDAFVAMVRSDVLGENRASTTPSDVYNHGATLRSAWQELTKKTSPFAVSLLEERISSFSNALYGNLGIVLVCLLMALASAFFIIKAITNPLGKAIRIFGSIEEGDYNSEINVQSNDEMGQLLSALKVMQETLRRQQEESDLFEENTRIRQGLDNVDASVMISNTEHEVVYVNEAAQNLFENAEADIKQDIPGFSASALLGTHIGEIHSDPERKKKLIDELSASHTETVELGARTFKVTMNPVSDEEGNRLGSVVEWMDLTQELQIEDEVQSIVEKSLSGDISERIHLEGKEGFYLRLSQGVNRMLEIIEGVVDDVGEVLAATASGDLTKEITSEYSGQFDLLKQHTNEVVVRLRDVVGNIKQSAATVKSASDEISQGNSNLSQRTEEQAAGLQQTASSMEQMTSTIIQNTENARQANELSSSASEIAETGGQVLSNAITAMGEINNASKKIADIIGVIDEIAFQTNLLALNASVEAARAGEQGRGFAVVAGEVRNLAGRSATAAKEIKELIEDSVHKIGEGSRLVNKSGETLDEIVDSVKKVSDIVSEITAASVEQSAGVEEVNKAVTQLDEMTQQNAALVEEIAAASETMGEQASELDRRVGFFTMDQNFLETFEMERSISVEEERRAGNRPWADPGAAKTSPNSAAVQKAVNAPDVVGNDDDWEEF